MLSSFFRSELRNVIRSITPQIIILSSCMIYSFYKQYILLLLLLGLNVGSSIQFHCYMINSFSITHKKQQTSLYDHYLLGRQQHKMSIQTLHFKNRSLTEKERTKRTSSFFSFLLKNLNSSSCALMRIVFPIFFIMKQWS